MIAAQRDQGDESDMIEQFGHFTIFYDPPSAQGFFSWEVVIQVAGETIYGAGGFPDRQSARADALREIGERLREEARV